MKSKYSKKTREQILREHFEQGISVSKLCKKYKISRTLFYRWKNRYIESGKDSTSLAPKAAGRVKKEVGKEVERKILHYAWEHPYLSLTEITDRVARIAWGREISQHLVYNILSFYDLSRRSDRVLWAKRYEGDFEKAWDDLVAERESFEQARKLSAEERLRLIGRVERGESVAFVCREVGISRALFYRWKRRYDRAMRKAWRRTLGFRLGSVTEADLLEAVRAREWTKPQVFAGQATPGQVKEVLALVLQHPSWGVQMIWEHLPAVDGKRMIGRHGVQRILERGDLNTVYKRQAWVDTRREAVPEFVRPVLAWLGEIKTILEQLIGSLAPHAPPTWAVSLFRGLLSSAFLWFREFRRLIASTLVSLLVFTLLFGWGYLLGTATSVSQAFGWTFASVALSMGSVFFLYSLKYYFSVAMVLSYSRDLGTGEDEEVSKRGSGAGVLGWLGQLFGLDVIERVGVSREERLRSPGLDPDLANITLQRTPFVSVHLPMYNEKRVAERLLRAVTAFDYPNFEVIVVDDSTDETTEVVEKFVREWNDQFSDSSSKTGPLIKVIHRETREGFKGAALKEALKHADKRTEFVVVFDADFVPYPDTLELFVKAFQKGVGSLARTKVLQSRVAAVQGYQWHVLNKSENWITRGVRSEYAGSYVIERSGSELYGGLKQIAGSVYMIRRDLLDSIGWGTSITEDFQLTLKLYEQGYKVVFTPYIQAPSECVSTLKRLVRQRMRWAEGHSHNIRKHFTYLVFGKWEDQKTQKTQIGQNTQSVRGSDTQNIRLSDFSGSQSFPNKRQWIPSRLTFSEKLEFIYLSPYYLQAAFFLVGTLAWIFSETVFAARLPFWTTVWGWSLVLTNLLSLPLMNTVGLFMEEAEERDFLGILSFFALTYLLVPFQAYAAVKGFIEEEEGPWFRTPKTGIITDIFRRGRMYKWIRGIFPGTEPVVVPSRDEAEMRRLPVSMGGGLWGERLAFVTANNQFNNFGIKPKKARWLGKVFVSGLLVVSMALLSTVGRVQVLSSFVGERQNFNFVTTANARVDNEAIPMVESQNENLAINTHKSIYELGEEAKIGVGVVDRYGNTVCDAGVSLQIRNPKHEIRNLKVENSPECGAHTVTNKPDYSANFIPEEVGTFTMQVSAQTTTGTYESENSFEVVETVPFSVERDGPVRLNPESAYTMNIKIIPQEDFSGSVVEVLPKEYGIKSISEEGSLKRNLENGFGLLEDQKEIAWDVDWQKGETYQLSYEFKTPLISPKLYKLGPLRFAESSSAQDKPALTTFEEGRKWQMVIDTVSTVFNGDLGDATEIESQRKAFRKPIGENEYYVFYKSSANPDRFRYKHSSDGSTWSTEITPVATNIGTDTNGSVDFKDRDGSTVDVAVTFASNNGKCHYLHGTVDGTTDAISWATGGECGALDNGVHPSITIDQGDRVWIVSAEDSNNSNKIEIMADNISNPTAPPDDINANKATGEVEAGISAQMHAEAVPLQDVSASGDEVGIVYLDHTNGNMYAMKATFSSGISLSSRSSAFTGTFSEGVFSVVDEDEDDDTAYVLYRDGAAVKQVTVTFPSGATGTPTFGTAATIKSITPDSVALSYDEGDNTLYAFYVDPADASLIRWEQSDVCSSPPCDPFTWGGSEVTIDDGSESVDFLSVGRRDWAANDQIPVTYTIQSATDVRFVETPEMLWLFFGVAPFLPGILKRRRRNAKENI